MSGLIIILVSLGTFFLLAFGGGLLVVGRIPGSPVQRLALAPFAGLFIVYLGATGCHLLTSPPAGWLLLAVPAFIGCWVGRTEARRWLKDPTCRHVLTGWGTFTAMSLILLSLIRNYSGGDWIGDWAGHYHRAQYFLHPAGDWTWMLERDPLGGRPPLQNLITAAMLAITGESFPAYQVITLLLGSLIYLPAALLLHQQPRALRWLPVVLLACPLVIQNLTYPWTKMGTNAWVLLALALGWSARDRLTVAMAAAALAAAVLSHYSAAVYLVVLAPVFAWKQWREGRPDCIAVVGLTTAAVLLTWFGWASVQLGAEAFGGTTTSSVEFTQRGGLDGQGAVFGENLARTFVPHFLLPRPPVGSPPSDPWAALRDSAFQLYQTNLLFAPGLAMLALLAGRLRSGLRHGGYGVLLGGIILLGIAVHTAPTHWGAAHICLQPLVILALVAAAHLLGQRARPPGWWGALLAVDLALGIGLQLGVESLAVPEAAIAWQAGQPLRELYGQAMWANSAAKAAFSYQFLGDLWPWPGWINGVAAAAGFVGLLARALRHPSAALPTGNASQH